MVPAFRVRFQSGRPVVRPKAHPLPTHGHTFLYGAILLLTGPFVCHIILIFPRIAALCGLIVLMWVFPLGAAPVLLNELPNGELPKVPWFSDVPFSNKVDTDDIPLDEVLEGTDSGRPAGTAVKRPRPHVPRRFTVEPDSDFEQDAALRDLLRSYLNITKVAGTVVNQPVQPSNNFSTAGRTPEVGSSIASISIAGQNEVNQMLATAVSAVLQPGVNGRGLMTFSIFGLGEFALVGGVGGITLSMGDMFTFSILGTGANSTLSWIGGADDGGGGLNRGAMPTTFAYVETGAKVSGGDVASASVQEARDDSGNTGAYGGGEIAKATASQPQLPRMLVLAYDILTYPGTLVTILVLLLLQLGKVGRKLKSHRTISSQRSRRPRLSNLQRGCDNS